MSENPEKMSKRERELRDALAKAEADFAAIVAQVTPELVVAQGKESGAARQRDAAIHAAQDAVEAILVRDGIQAANDASPDATALRLTPTSTVRAHRRLVEAVSRACGWPFEAHDELKPKNHGRYTPSPMESAVRAIYDRAVTRAQKDPEVVRLRADAQRAHEAWSAAYKPVRILTAKIDDAKQPIYQAQEDLAAYEDGKAKRAMKAEAAKVTPEGEASRDAKISHARKVLAAIESGEIKLEW